MTPDDVLILGAGPSGLAIAAELQRRGVTARVVDAAGQLASAWRRRHPALRLNTHRRLSHLPGLALPPEAGPFPSRDDFVAYLERYARVMRVAVEFGVRAERIDRDEDGYRVDSTAGVLRARQVVVATGPDRVPVLPSWPGRDGFAGELLHAADFAAPRSYDGRRVLIVGGGNSGVDLANHLVRAAPAALWMSVRRATTIAPQYVLGVPLHFLALVAERLPGAVVDRGYSLLSRLTLGDLRRLGMPATSEGAYSRWRRDEVNPAIDTGFVAALGTDRIRVVAQVERLDGPAVHFRDGAVLEPDTILCATGYRRGLEGLVGHLGALDERGRPRGAADRPCPGAPGLWFFGLDPSIFGSLHARAREAPRLAAAIVREASRRR